MPKAKPREDDRNYKGHFFGLELNKFLVSRNYIEMDLVRAMNRLGYPVSRQMISLLVRNERGATPEMCDKLAQGLKLDRTERERLHRAAAIDAGYQIGGTR